MNEAKNQKKRSANLPVWTKVHGQMIQRKLNLFFFVVCLCRDWLHSFIRLLRIVLDWKIIWWRLFEKAQYALVKCSHFIRANAAFIPYDSASGACPRRHSINTTNKLRFKRGKVQVFYVRKQRTATENTILFLCNGWCAHICLLCANANA